MFSRKLRKILYRGGVVHLQSGDVFMMPGGSCYFVRPADNPTDLTAEPTIVQLEVKNLPTIK